MKLPTHLHDMALIVKGNVKAAQFEEVQLPTMKRKMETKHLPGMKYPIDVDRGPDGTLKITMTGSEIDEDLIGGFGQCDGQLARIQLRSIYKEVGGCKKHLHQVFAQGLIEEIDLGSQKKGETTQRKYVMTCYQFRYLSKGKEIININALAPDDEDKQMLGMT